MYFYRLTWQPPYLGVPAEGELHTATHAQGYFLRSEPPQKGPAGVPRRTLPVHNSAASKRCTDRWLLKGVSAATHWCLKTGYTVFDVKDKGKEKISTYICLFLQKNKMKP